MPIACSGGIGTAAIQLNPKHSIRFFYWFKYCEIAFNDLIVPVIDLHNPIEYNFNILEEKITKERF